MAKKDKNGAAVDTAPAEKQEEKKKKPKQPPKTIPEEGLKIVIAIILFLLCVAFFAGLAWVLIVELDAKFVSTAGLPFYLK